MIKLTLTLFAETDELALHVLRAFSVCIDQSSDNGEQSLITGKDAYSLSRSYGNASCDVARFTPVCGSEDEINRLAREFSYQVCGYFIDDGPLDSNEDFQAILERNRAEPNPSICHTHDFCDANILMSNAWEETFPHEPFCAQNGFHAELWSAAWEQARKAEFQLPKAPLTSRDDPAT